MTYKKRKKEREREREGVAKERKIDSQMKASNSATLVTNSVSYKQEVENYLKP